MMKSKANTLLKLRAVYTVPGFFLCLVFLMGCKSASPSKPVVKCEPAAPVSVSKPAVPSATVPAVAEPALVRATAFEGAGWKPLFDGKSLAGWQVTDFAGGHPTECENGLLVIEAGDALSGINYTNGGLPTMNYEVALDAMKLHGSDFFCGLTFPVDKSFCSLILGGWGGSVTGLSSVDDEDASENETSKFVKYEANHWYRVRVRVTPTRIEAWLDAEKIVDLKTKERRIGLRFGEIEESKPLGIATYQTRAAIREIKVRTIDGQ